jgi:hypothetical protein
MNAEGIKIARHIAVPGLKRGAWVGGQWSAGERFPKAPNFARVASEEGFDPKAVSSLWLRDEKQVGWFVFNGKPQRGVPLAWYVIQRMTQGQLPWRGVFNLGDLWWFVTCDEKGAIHPSFDVAMAPQDKDAFENDHLSELSSFPHGVYCGTPEESWAWLFDGVAESRALQMAPVMAAAQARRAATASAAGLISLAVVGQIGLHLWHKHEQQVLAREQAIQQALARQKLRAQIVAEMQANGALGLRVARVWAQTPRPWTSAPSWDAVMGAATHAMTPISMDGWRLVKVVGTVQGTSLSIERMWRRSELATVSVAPSGSVAADGNSIIERSVVTLAPRAGGALALPAQETLARTVMAQSQVYAKVCAVRLGTFTAYRPPVPNFVPKNMVQKFNPPVLWRSAPVTIEANRGIAPDLRNATLFDASNIPTRVEIDFTSHSLSWKLEGIEYAKA